MASSQSSRGNKSSVLIINDPPSAVDVLNLISKYSRVFTHHPIRILRADVANDRSMIIAFTKQYNIQNVPALITRQNQVVVGQARICEFIPRLVHEINNMPAGLAGLSGQTGGHCGHGGQRAQYGLTSEDAFRQHQLEQSMEMDDYEDGDEQPCSSEEIGQRIAQYKREMEKRRAHILEHIEEKKGGPISQAGRTIAAISQTKPNGCGSNPKGIASPASRAPPASQASRASNASAPRRATNIPIPAARKKQDDDPFYHRFEEMLEETPMS